MREESADRRHFRAATEGFIDLVGRVTPTDWQRPALGEWDVRSLTGHAARAFVTLETYTAEPATDAPGTIRTPAAYYVKALGDTADRAALDEQIAQRGRAAGHDLGDDPLVAVCDLADRALAVLDRHDDDYLFSCFAGPTTLGAYLPTRTLELVVHGLDMAVALETQPPYQFDEPVAATVSLVASLADSVDAAVLLLAMTGRTALPDGFSLL